MGVGGGVLPSRQLLEDRKLLKRIDDYGKDLTNSEVKMLESFLVWVESRELTPAQRKVAEDIDDRRVT